ILSSSIWCAGRSEKSRKERKVGQQGQAAQICTRVGSFPYLSHSEYLFFIFPRLATARDTFPSASYTMCRRCCAICWISRLGILSSEAGLCSGFLQQPSTPIFPLPCKHTRMQLAHAHAPMAFVEALLTDLTHSLNMS